MLTTLPCLFIIQHQNPDLIYPLALTLFAAGWGTLVVYILLLLRFVLHPGEDRNYFSGSSLCFRALSYRFIHFLIVLLLTLACLQPSKYPV